MNITDKKVTEYIDGLYNPLHPYLMKLRTEAEEQSVPIILKDTETLLLTLLEIKNPMHILEIGTAVGYSALCFAFAKPGAQVTTIEIQERMCNAAKCNFEKAGVSDRIRLIQGDAVTVLEKLNKQREAGRRESYDFVFIDGAKGHYLEIWQSCLKICPIGAVIVSDNILYRGMTAADEYLDIRRNKTIVNRMRKYLDHITSLPDVATTVLPVGDGVAVSIIGAKNEKN